MTYRPLPAEGEAHRDVLMRLWRENMSDRRIASVLERRRAWLYDRNPAGSALTWLVEHVESGEIIGAASAYARLTRVGDRVVKAGILADFVIAHGHRIAGPAVMVQRAIMESSRAYGFEFLYGYPNKGAEPIFPRLRYKKIGETSLWVKPLRTAPQLQKFIHPMAARLGGLFGDRLLIGNDLRLALTRPGGLRVCSAPGLDNRFDALWDRAQRRVPIAGVRNAEYLRWRYADHPTQKYSFFALENKSDNSLQGYVAYSAREDKVFIEDLFCDGDLRDTEALLIRFSTQMRREGFSSICATFVGDERVLQSLERLQFIRRPGSRKLIAMVDKTQPDAMRDLVYDASSWSMHDGELDI
jgi:hypothetical protein